MLSRTAKHALTAVALLAELPVGAYAGAADVARQTGAPPNYLGKLLRTLADAGVVESQKGKGGGFRLTREPHELPLLEIVEPIDHVSRWTACFFGRERCSDRAPCGMHQRWANVRDVYTQFLQETTVADMIRTPELHTTL